MLEQTLDKIVDPSGGANQSRMRDYNERLVLSLVRRHEALPKSEIARRTGLSAQTVSVIMRSLEADGLLLRGEPQRGKVGQPSIPMSLNPDGVFSMGIKVGRRTVDLVLVDFLGKSRKEFHDTYDYPKPQQILEFARNSIDHILNDLGPGQQNRIAGIGISMPFTIWNWASQIGAPEGAMDEWRNFDLLGELENFCPFPAFFQNDGTSACGAELVFGRGAEFQDFAYFFVGTFIGGGLVLNHSVYLGRTGNAGAFGSMPVAMQNGTSDQLINHASLFELEARLKSRGKNPSAIWLSPDNWPDFGECVDEWLIDTSRFIAFSIVSVCSVIDFEAVVIDGAFPDFIREKLVRQVTSELYRLDLRGIDPPQIVGGMLGSQARVVGGASLPLFARYLLDQNVVFKQLGNGADPAPTA